MKFTINIDCDTVAFKGNPNVEVARLLDVVKTALSAGIDAGKLIDTHGNTVGGFRSAGPVTGVNASPDSLLAAVRVLEGQLARLLPQASKNQSAGVELYKSLRRCTTDLNAQEQAAKQTPLSAADYATLDEARGRLMLATKSVMRDLFDLDVTNWSQP